MAKFEVSVHTVKISPHPGANRLDIAQIDGYSTCVAKDSLRDGDLAAYIPDGALVPNRILETIGLVGKLAGADLNRVKPMMLRGILSQGLAVPAQDGDLFGTRVEEGQDVTELLGIVKYEPEPPAELLGLTLPAHGECLDFDVEDARKYPNAIQEGEPVVITEKLHGVMACLGVNANNVPIVTSKGLGHTGLKFDVQAPENESNIYVRAWRKHDETIRRLHAEHGQWGEGTYVLGEIVGMGLQDLGYAIKELTFHAFDIYVGNRRKGRWFNPDEGERICRECDIARVPEITRIPFSMTALAELAQGKTTMAGALHRREGVVARLATERFDAVIGRVILKMKSPKYLTRSGGTEYS